MNVALDATPLVLSSGGLHRYVSELVRALACEFPDDGFVMVSDQPFELPDRLPPNVTCGEGPRSRIERNWWSYGLGRELARRRSAVFHGTNFEVPYLPVLPSVLTLHDLSPWRDPEWHYGAGRVRSRTPWLVGLGLATMLITPTESVRREAIERFRIAPHRVVAIPEAAAPHLCAVETEPPDTPHFLYVGALEPRKNLAVILDAWRTVKRRYTVDLVLAGRCREDFAAPPAEPGLHLPGEVPEAALARLYSGALVFLYPSLYEGFGLPVLEAMQCGAAVFSSSDAALAEVGGEASVRLDARDPAAWAGAMTFALEHPEWIKRLRARSLERAREFTWRTTARRTREVYAEAIRRFGA